MISRIRCSGGKPGLGQHSRDLRDQVRVLELLAGQVHADSDRRISADPGVPLHRLATGLEQDPLAERVDGAGLLSERNELVGPDHAARGVAPAHQRLRRNDRAGRQVNDRLVVRDQLAPEDSSLKVDLELEAFEDRRVHARLERLVTPLAGALCAVHRQVGVAKQVVAAAILAGRDADARRDVDLLALDFERSPQLGQNALGHQLGSPRRADVLEQDRELVAAEARRRIGWPQAATQSARHEDEQLVARDVPEAVVDVLEAVEVEEEHGDGRLASARARLGVLQPVQEQGAVREPGQRVVERLMHGVLEVARIGERQAGVLGERDEHLLLGGAVLAVATV